MNSLFLNSARAFPEAFKPTREPDSAGWDLRTPEPFSLYSGEFNFIDTGVILELPSNWMVKVMGRSGLAMKHGIGLVNGVGLVDPGYRGSIGVMLINHGPDKHCFSKGDRIAQFVVEPLLNVFIDERSPVNTTTIRGTDGFGSSGR